MGQAQRARARQQWPSAFPSGSVGSVTTTPTVTPPWRSGQTDAGSPENPKLYDSPSRPRPTHGDWSTIRDEGADILLNTANGLSCAGSRFTKKRRSARAGPTAEDARTLLGLARRRAALRPAGALPAQRKLGARSRPAGLCVVGNAGVLDLLWENREFAMPASTGGSIARGQEPRLDVLWRWPMRTPVGEARTAFSQEAWRAQAAAGFDAPG